MNEKTNPRFAHIDDFARVYPGDVIRSVPVQIDGNVVRLIARVDHWADPADWRIRVYATDPERFEVSVEFFMHAGQATSSMTIKTPYLVGAPVANTAAAAGVLLLASRIVEDAAASRLVTEDLPTLILSERRKDLVTKLVTEAVKIMVVPGDHDGARALADTFHQMLAAKPAAELMTMSGDMLVTELLAAERERREQ